jgi:hypothetical protein
MRQLRELEELVQFNLILSISPRDDANEMQRALLYFNDTT